MKLSLPKKIKIGSSKTSAVQEVARAESLGSSLESLENPFNNVSAIDENGGDLSSQGQNYQDEQALDAPVSHDNTENHDLELLAADYKLKIKRSLIQVSGLLKEPYTLIAFQAGSFGLHGALISNGRYEAKIGAFATSSRVDFTRAITEVLEKLKLEHKRLPKRAILLTPSVVSDLVTLPVSPLRPRTNDQMQELIRWELEGAITQQNVQWKVGSILVERGHMTAEQRNHVLEELEIRQAQGGPKSLARFGDLAVQLGHISRENLEECFALQGKLVAVDDDLEYGWQASEVSNAAPSDEVLLSLEDDSDSSHPWLVSGMSKTVRRRWLGAFNLNGISLEAFYPTVSSAFASLAQRDASDGVQNEQKQLLLEIYQEQLALISGDKRTVTEIETNGRRMGPISASECLDLLEGHVSGVDRLYIASNGIEDVRFLMPELAEQLNIEVQQLSAPDNHFTLPEHIHPDVLLGLHGVSNHFLKHMPAKRLSRVNTREVKEQAWKSWLTPKSATIAASIIMLCGMFGFLGWMQWKTTHHAARLAELTAKYDQEMSLKQQLESAYGDSIDIIQKIKQVNSTIAVVKSLLADQAANNSYRQQSVQSLLKVFVLSLSPYVSISNITKEAGDQFTLEAQASSNLEGQEFVARVDRLAKPLRYQVTDSVVVLQKGKDTSFHVTMTLDYNAGLSGAFEKLVSRGR